MSEEEDNFEFVKIKTNVLKVRIHCEGCMHKVKKLLRKIEGVYEVKIDGKEHKVTVSGNVDCTTLIKKLAKSGKHAEVWPTNQLDNADYLNQMQTLINDLDSSGPQTFPDNTIYDDIYEWGLGRYLNDNRRAVTQMDGELLGWREDDMSNRDSMDGSSMRSAMNFPGYSTGSSQLAGLRNFYMGLPAYEYYHQLPAMMTNINGSWYGYPYPRMYTNMHMHPIWTMMGNTYMHQPMQMMNAFD